MKNFFYRHINAFSDRQLALIFFISSLILKTGYAIFFFLTKPIPESNLYYELAQEIIEQGKIFYETSDPYYDFPGPLLPLFNALTMSVFGVSYLWLYLTSAIGASLITFYTYKLSRRFLDKSWSFIIGLWSTFYIFYFYYTPSAGKDIWMAFFLVYLIYKLVVLLKAPVIKLSQIALFSFMNALSFHLDERFLIFTPLIFLALFLKDTEHFKKLNLNNCLIFTILTIMFMVPWTIRNYQKYDKIVLISNRTEAYTDKIFGYDTNEHIMNDFNNIKGVFYIHEYQIDSIINGSITKTDGGWQIREAQRAAMERGLRPSPLTGFKAVYSRLRTMFEPLQLKERFERTGYFYYKKSLKHNIVTFLSYGVLFLLSFPGFFFLYKKDPTIFWVFLAVICIYTLIHLLAIPYTNWRYRLPLDSLFIITGFFGVSQIVSSIQKRSSRKI